MDWTGRLRPEGGTGCRWDSGEDWVKSIIFPVMMSVQTKKGNSKGPWTCPGCHAIFRKCKELDLHAK